jgi:hypothetical protein
MHWALRFRKLGREWLRGKPLHLSLMFRSAVGALKVQHIGPDTGEGDVVDIKLKINRLSGLTAPAAETTHRIAREPQKKQSCFAAAILLLSWLYDVCYMRPE